MSNTDKAGRFSTTVTFSEAMANFRAGNLIPEPEPSTPSRRDWQHAAHLQAYDAMAAEARALFDRKNQEYGDSISLGGVLGAIIELLGIAGRLREVGITPLLTCAEEAASLSQLPSKAARDEILRDKFLDAVNYGLIGLIMLEEDNYKGN